MKDKFAEVALRKVQFGSGANNQTMHKVVVAVSTVMTEQAAGGHVNDCVPVVRQGYSPPLK